jgi:hypothetical protein
MADISISSARLMAAYGVGRADRISIASPISWDPMRDIDAERPGGWRADPDFMALARLVQEHCDPPAPYNPVEYPGVFSPLSYQRFLEAPERFVERLEDKEVSPKRTRTTYILHTPGGDLTWAYDEDEGIETRWDVAKPVACPADVEKLLSVPFDFEKPPSDAYEPFRRHRREAGRLCIGGAWINSMVAMLVGVMDYGLVLEWVLDEPSLLKALADAWLERVWAKVDYLLAQGVGPFWHFNGVERASPPMMGRRQWEELVIPYDGEVMRRIKARDPEAKIHVHCHGKVGSLLDSWLELGVDSIDPVEPPPQGDIELVAARRHVGDRMTLCGNIEFSWMDTATPDEIEHAVIRALREAGTERTVLWPSATPHQRHSARFNANARRYIETALKFGARATA